MATIRSSRSEADTSTPVRCGRVSSRDADRATRLMVSMTAWVSPQQGCTYCHKAGEDFSADSLYTKVVSRRTPESAKYRQARQNRPITLPRSSPST